MYRANIKGDKTDPCLTPELILKKLDVADFHLMQVQQQLNRFSKSRSKSGNSGVFPERQNPALPDFWTRFWHTSNNNGVNSGSKV